MRQCAQCQQAVDIAEYYEAVRQPLGSRWSFCSLSCLLHWSTKRHAKEDGDGIAGVQAARPAG